jgi:hypothetical protein
MRKMVGSPRAGGTNGGVRAVDGDTDEEDEEEEDDDGGAAGAAAAMGDEDVAGSEGDGFCKAPLTEAIPTVAVALVAECRTGGEGTACRGRASGPGAAIMLAKASSNATCLGSRAAI